MGVKGRPIYSIKTMLKLVFDGHIKSSNGDRASLRSIHSLGVNGPPPIPPSSSKSKLNLISCHHIMSSSGQWSSDVPLVYNPWGIKGPLSRMVSIINK